MSARLNSKRLLRARSVGFAMIGIMGFLIAGFVIQPIASSFDNLAPPPQTVPVPEFQDPDTIPEHDEIMEENPDIDPMDIENPSEGIPLEDEPNFDEPVTSDDDILTQIGDENSNSTLPNPFPTSPTVGLLAEITLIDSNGLSTTQEFRQEFISFAFLGEQESGRDFETGFIEIRMWIEGEPDVAYGGNGFFDFLVGGNSVDNGLATISTGGVTDQNGLLPIEFALPSGQRSNVYTFSFEDNADRFPLNSRQIITVEVKDFVILKELRDKFSIILAEIFTMDILNSADAITFTNLEGGSEVAFPTDSSLKISRNTMAGVLPKVAMGAITVTDPNGLIVAGAPATTAQLCGLAVAEGHRCSSRFGASEFLIDVLLARDTTYNIKITDPTALDFDVTFPLSQKNLDFSCRIKWEDPLVQESASRYILTSAGVYWQAVAYRALNILDSPIICNMPLDAVNGTTTFPPPNSIGVRVGV